MTKKYIRLVYFALMLSLLFPVIVLGVADYFSSNVVNGLTMIFILAIFVGLFSSRYTVSWLIIILTTIATGFLLLGYVVMPFNEKILLIIAFPIESSLLSVVRHHVLHWNITQKNEDDFKRHLSHYDLNLKLQTYYNANKFYQRELHQFAKYSDMNLWMNVELINWARHQQIEEYHPRYHAEVLRNISMILKKTRLKSEFIYYTGDGTFMVISPQLDDSTFKKINEKTQKKLQHMDVEFPIKFKVAAQKVDLDNYKKFPDLRKLEKHLESGLETDIIVEYLKDDQND
ncbi:hypothetical protein [uncultured Lactobacillus sp.]|uniref:hypothetical protein n=1 Tax=uncultured Lactobacillus sp. TaxID=153152 RepID=UPI0028051192|nr:hypothetical protein [uncultured Lactobacillus sp.]